MAEVLPFKRLPWRSRLRAVASGRCPRCQRAPIFRGRLAMHPVCPSCGLRFEREPGYFTGAMYVSYVLAVPVMAVCILAVHLIAPDWSFERTVAVGAVGFLPFVPAIFRWSRILWIHLDRTVDPTE